MRKMVMTLRLETEMITLLWGSDDARGGYTTATSNKERVGIFVMVSKKPYGDSGSQFFDTLRQITHESFMHADLEAWELRDDGYKNSSSIPKEYRQYDTSSSQHGRHYYVQNEYLNNLNNEKVNRYFKEWDKILKQANMDLNLKLGNVQIKNQMWNFTGSFVKVDSKWGLTR